MQQDKPMRNICKNTGRFPVKFKEVMIYLGQQAREQDRDLVGLECEAGTHIKGRSFVRFG